ncbi:hypothetical protein E2C01_024359 [Portunus trituberculatus]|uniref:Uncharacterized protein n=1 Tax=Portunus trituberculatus TaxID=210409 RepID=A0A5B7EAD8_PORTR|nr:hypothetical protein [Portunus trituberculatus]
MLAARPAGPRLAVPKLFSCRPRRGCSGRRARVPPALETTPSFEFHIIYTFPRNTSSSSSNNYHSDCRIPSLQLSVLRFNT